VLLLFPAQAQLLSVLPLVFQHSTVRFWRRDIGTVKLVCKSWKAALADFPACFEYDVCLILPGDFTELTRFTEWLGQYGHLLSQLTLYVHSREEDNDDSDADDLNPFAGMSLCPAAEHVLVLALQLAAARLKPLCFQSFSYTGLSSTSLLPSLPAASLTMLDLSVQQSNAVTKAALATGLGCLTNLRSLKLNFRCPDDCPLSPTSFSSPPYGLAQLQTLNIACKADLLGEHLCLASLTSLTSLVIVSEKEVDLKCVPEQLQNMDVTVGLSCLLRIPQVTSLTCLNVKSPEGFKPGSQLPPALPLLKLHKTLLPGNPGQLFASVQRLEVEGGLRLPGASQWPVALRALGNLGGLDLGLSYEDPENAATTAAAWGQLPQLQRLVLGSPWSPVEIDSDDESDGDVPVSEAATARANAILVGLGAATSLTSLIVNVDLAGKPFGVQIGGLVKLRALSIIQPGRSSSDSEHMLQLRNLTQLTQLKLVQCTLGIATAAVVLSKLLSLKVLHLEIWSKLNDDAIPLVVQGLTALRKLAFTHKSPLLDGASISLLAQLSRLEVLSVFCCRWEKQPKGVEQLRELMPWCRVSSGKHPLLIM
jgi:hypothetical protein